MVLKIRPYSLVKNKQANKRRSFEGTNKSWNPTSL